MTGPALMLLSIALFTLLDANSKLLSGEYGLGQVVALRYAVLLPLMLIPPPLRPAPLGPLGTAHPWLTLARSLTMLASAACFFLAFRELPLAEGYLVFFTSPLLTLALAALLLRERVPPAAWFWCGVGFAGVLLSVLPKLGGGAASPAGYLAIALGTLAFALTQTLNRRLRHEPGVARVLLWPSVLGLLVYGPFALRDWVAPPPLDWAMLLANGLFAGAASVTTAMAFRHADAARLGPFGFAALPISLVLDFALWGVRPDPWTLGGAAVVVLACVMSERARRQGIVAGKTCVPSAPSGSGVTAPTQASGSGP